MVAAVLVVNEGPPGLLYHLLFYQSEKEGKKGIPSFFADGVRLGRNHVLEGIERPRAFSR
jgi:hypothetical protein